MEFQQTLLLYHAKKLETLADAAGERSLRSVIDAHLAHVIDGDYFAILGYIEMNSETEPLLQTIREKVLARTGVATCLGFGPRFLHSTGQAYKGGPNTGVFLQITAEPAADLDVPGQSISFGVIEAAQARGDFDVLTERGRRALRLHITGDIAKGLATIGAALQDALT